MFSGVTLRSRWRGKGWTKEGSGIRIGSYILSNYNSICLEGDDILGWNGNTDLPVDISVFVDENFAHYSDSPASVKRCGTHPAIIIKIWSCKSFRHYFNLYFDRDDFGEKNVNSSGTFVLLTLVQPHIGSTNLNLEELFATLDSESPSEYVSQGMRVSTSPNNDLKCPPIYGIVSYTSSCGIFFTVDLPLTKKAIGSPVYKSESESEERVCLGMVIYKDMIPYPFEVFPACMSVKHILSSLCNTSLCHLKLTKPTSSQPGLLKSAVFPDKLTLVVCGTNVGTGIVISQGIILTCSHIISDCLRYEVTIYINDKMKVAKVLYKATLHNCLDVALLYISSSSSFSSNVEIAVKPPTIGEEVLAVGFPYIKGLQRKEPWVSTGQILAVDDSGHLLASSVVHEGFSGGAVLNSYDQVIGMICGKAFPLRNTLSPPRLTQVLPAYLIREYLLRFINSKRNELDVLLLNEQLEACSRKMKHRSKL